MSKDAVIETFELTKEFRHPFFTWLVRARAVTDLTFSVGRGEVFGLLGPNGSGKTTTIKLILGLLFPTRGQAALFGRRPDDQAVKGRLGYLPEESYLYRFLDAEETLDFYGRLFNLPRHERRHRIEALLDLTGLRRERRRPIAEFSKGMQRRIGLAQSLINDPELVILDEPTTGLDPIGTREIKDLILELKAKGKTVLLSSHLLADVEDVCDRVVILYGGRVRAQGPMESLLQEERLTQITAEIDPETLAEIQALIRRRCGDETEIRVAPPQERLESFFLRVVAEARTQRLDTSGVDASQGRLDFLSANRQDDLLQQLLHGDAGKAPPPPAHSRLAEPGSAPGRSLLEVLSKDPAAADLARTAETPEAPEAPAPAPAADKTLLDELTKREDEPA